MDKGTKVIRKTDIHKNIPAFGIVQGTLNGRVIIEWTYGRTHSSSLKIRSVLEVTPELEARIVTEHNRKNAERKAAMDRERIYVCTNVNPAARGSSEGHPKRLLLMENQVVDGKCYYCGKLVIKREL